MSAASSARAPAIDALRGAVMVLMLLDHARDFFVGTAKNPTALTTTTLPLFATRWVTHFCAPVFVLLAGTSAYLFARKHGLAEARKFLLTRGLWLVLLELTVVRFAWIPEPFFRFFLIQVIWVLGWSMVVLAALSYLPLRAVVGLGALIIGAHNLLDGVDRANLGAWEPFWNLLHERAFLHFETRRVFVSYPLLPWIGVIALGFGLGSWFEKPSFERQRRLARTGLGLVAAFFVVRAVNLYGDPQPWSAQARGVAFTLLSFFNCEKYPPSLSFVLMTLGPSLLALAAFERWTKPWPLLLTLGRAPLFFYVTHLYLLRFTALPFALARFGKSALMPPPGHAGSPEYPLWSAYLATLLALLVLYPMSRWFARKKAAGRARFWSYL